MYSDEISPLLLTPGRARLRHSSSVDSIRTEDEEFAIKHGMETAQKNIGFFGSFALVTNNIAGPAMMGLPLLFQQAGVIPVIIAIVFMCVASSVTGTMLAESIALIPGNVKYDLQVEYANAFVLLGRSWQTIAQVLFLIACMVQAITGIIETSQSLDSFIASFVLGKTYALRIWPEPEIISWSSESCHNETETADASGIAECTPFHSNGALVLSLGYVIVSLLLMPLGRGNLKETIVVQYISFFALIFLLSVFYLEFDSIGFPVSVPLFGDSYAQLAGVVLFNYAFSITIPSWLIEKTDDVNANQIIWSATSFSSLIYITFGLTAAMSFSGVTDNVLTLLASPKVHHFTRVCAAVFGLSIIGSGFVLYLYTSTSNMCCSVPVFCVIVKHGLYAGRVCSAKWSFFWGALSPYAISWMLYQGSLLMSLLNWTGLVVNGSVAFLLPLTLALWVYYRGGVSSLSCSAPNTPALNGGNHKYGALSEQEKDEYIEVGYTPAVELDRPPSALLASLEPYRYHILVIVISAFAAMISFTIIIDIIEGIRPEWSADKYIE